MESTPPLADASLGARLGAKVIDFIIVNGLNFAFRVIWAEPVKTAPGGFMVALALSGLFLFQIAYIAGFLERFGATPGKLLLRLKVVNADGTPLTASHAFRRAVVETLGLNYLLMVAGCCCVIYLGVILLDFYDPLFNRATGNDQPWHDRICGTRVVNKST